MILQTLKKQKKLYNSIKPLFIEELIILIASTLEGDNNACL